MVFLLTASLLATASHGASPPTELPPYLAGLPQYTLTDDKRPKICPAGTRAYSNDCYPATITDVPASPVNTGCLRIYSDITNFGYFSDDVVVTSFPNTIDESQLALFTKKKDLTNNWTNTFTTGKRRDTAHFEKLYPFLGSPGGNLNKERKAFFGTVFDNNASVNYASLSASFNHRYDEFTSVNVRFTEMVVSGEYIGNSRNPASPNYDPNSRRLSGTNEENKKPRIPGSVDPATNNVIRDGFKLYSNLTQREEQPKGLEENVEDVFSGRRKLQESGASDTFDWNKILDDDLTTLERPVFDFNQTAPFIRTMNPEVWGRENAIFDMNIKYQEKLKCNLGADYFYDYMHWQHPYIKNYIGEPDKFPKDMMCDDRLLPMIYSGRGNAGTDGFEHPHYANIIGQLFHYLPTESGRQYGSDYYITYRMSYFCARGYNTHCRDTIATSYYQVDDPIQFPSTWTSGDNGGRLEEYAPGGSKFKKVVSNPEINWTNFFIQSEYETYSPRWPDFHPDYRCQYSWPSYLWGIETRRLDGSANTEIESESDFFMNNVSDSELSGRSLSEDNKPSESKEIAEYKKHQIRLALIEQYKVKREQQGRDILYFLGLDDLDDDTSKDVRKLAEAEAEASVEGSEEIIDKITRKVRIDSASVADLSFGTGDAWKEKAKEYETRSTASMGAKGGRNNAFPQCEVGYAPSNFTGKCYHAANRYYAQIKSVYLGTYALNDDVRMYDGGRHELNKDFYTRGNKTYSLFGATARPLKSGPATGFMPPDTFAYKQWEPTMLIPDMSMDQSVIGRFMYPVKASAYVDTTENLTLPPPINTFESPLEDHFLQRFILPDRALFEDIDLVYTPDFSKMRRVISPYGKIMDQSVPPCDIGLFVREAESKINPDDLTRYSWEVYSQAIGGRCGIDGDVDQKHFMPLFFGAVNIWSAGEKHTLKIAVRDSGREQPVYSKTVRPEKVTAEKKRSTPLTSIGGNGFNYYKNKHNLGEHYKLFYGRSREDGYNHEGYHSNRIFQNVTDIESDFDGSKVRGKAGRQYIKSMDRFMQRYYSPNAYDTWFETSEQSPSYRIDDGELTEFRMRRQTRLADRRKYAGRNRIARSQKNSANRYKRDYKKSLPCAYCPSLAPTIFPRYDAKKTIGW